MGLTQWEDVYGCSHASNNRGTVYTVYTEIQTKLLERTECFQCEWLNFSDV